MISIWMIKWFTQIIKKEPHKIQVWLYPVPNQKGYNYCSLEHSDYVDNKMSDKKGQINMTMGETFNSSDTNGLLQVVALQWRKKTKIPSRSGRDKEVLNVQADSELYNIYSVIPRCKLTIKL